MLPPSTPTSTMMASSGVGELVMVVGLLTETTGPKGDESIFTFIDIEEPSGRAGMPNINLISCSETVAALSCFSCLGLSGFEIDSICFGAAVSKGIGK